MWTLGWCKEQHSAHRFEIIYSFYLDSIQCPPSALAENCIVELRSSLWIGKIRKVCFFWVGPKPPSNRFCLKKSVLQILSMSSQHSLVLLLLRLCAFPYSSPVALFFKQRRRQRRWRRRWGQERSWSSASGWRRLTGSIWGFLCEPPPHWAECPPR